jgi:uncharacterized membrane protein YfcA
LTGGDIVPKWLFYVLILIAGWLLIFRGKLPTLPKALQPPSPAHAPPAPKSLPVAAVETGGQLLGTLISGVFHGGSATGPSLPSGAPTGGTVDLGLTAADYGEGSDASILTF